MLQHAVFGALFLVCSSALATEVEVPTTYSFTGTVTAIQGANSSHVTVGQTVSIVLTVNFADNIFQRNAAKTDGRHTGGISMNEYPLILNGQVRGSNIPYGYADNFEVQKSLNGVYGYFISSVSQMAAQQFSLNFSTSKAGVVKNLLIPQKINPSDFQTITFTYQVAPNDSYSGTIEPPPP